MSCQICAENFNNSNHSVVKCNNCSEDVCKTCMRAFLLTQQDVPSCMFCKSSFDTIFLATNLNKTWLNCEYKLHIEQVLLDKQISQLPDTQEKAVSAKNIKKIEEINKSLMEERKKLNKAVRELSYKINTNINAINNLKRPSKVASKFTYKCPCDECQGFLDDKWCCGLCESKVCKDCMEILSDNHVCNPEKIETIKLIKKDTKPCPGCGEFIHKIHGCDQMWCPTCKVAFSWINGTIEKGAIHNPEYYRWMREHEQELPRQENNDHCGQLPDGNFLLSSLRKIWVRVDNDDRLETIALHNCHRAIVHINNLEWLHEHFEQGMNNYLEDLRVKYLLNDITKEEWKNRIVKVDKQFKLSTDKINIWRLVKDVITPLLWYTVELFHGEKPLVSQIKEIKIKLENVISKLYKFRNFVNDSFMRINKVYKNSVEMIAYDWSIVPLAEFNRMKEN